MMDARSWNRRRLALLAPIALAMLAWHLTVGLQPARASMDLTLGETPDIYSGFIQVRYDSPVADLLTATGYAMKLKDGTGTTYNIQKSADNVYVPGSFALQATIDSAGQLTPGGTVTFGGYIPTMGYTSGTILTGSLTALGYGAAQEPLEFLFEVTGGDAAGLFGGVSAVAGLILHTRAFRGNFLDPFSNSGGSSNTGHVVPEPATAVLWPLLAVAGAVIGWKRRRRGGGPNRIAV